MSVIFINAKFSRWNYNKSWLSYTVSFFVEFMELKNYWSMIQHNSFSVRSDNVTVDFQQILKNGFIQLTQSVKTQPVLILKIQF